jgi:hypothetical protein
MLIIGPTASHFIARLAVIMSDVIDTTETLHQRMNAEISKLLAETSKLNAETSRINAENSTYPWLPILTMILGSTGMIGAVVALVVAFHR